MAQRKRKRLHWIDLAMWPSALVVTDDRESYLRFLREQGIEDAKEFPTDRGVNGSVQFFKRNGTGEGMFVMVLDPRLRGLDRTLTVVHEAVHITDFLFEFVGEEEPGTETRAYLTEWITRETLRALSG